MPDLNLSVEGAEQFIDIRNTARRYQSAHQRFFSNPDISDHNKELVRNYLRDASLGKTMPGRQKKKIGQERMSIYMNHLVTALLHTKKDLDTWTIKDMEDFIEDLENDRVSPRRKQIKGEVSLQRRLAPYSPRFKVDIKHTLRKFYKWLWGNNRLHPPIVDWIDTSCPAKEVPALSEQNIKSLILSQASLAAGL